MLVTTYGPRADPKQMTTLQCEEVASLIDTVSHTSAVFLGVLAAARAGLESGALSVLPMDPPMLAGARYAYVTLVGRTEAPVMAQFRRFVDERLRD